MSVYWTLAGPVRSGFLTRIVIGDCRPGAAAEDLAAFPAGLLARGPLVAAQVEHVDAGELLGEGLAHAVGGVGVEEAAVGDERDHAAILDAQDWPT